MTTRPIIITVLAASFGLAACAGPSQTARLGDSCGDLGWGRIIGGVAGAVGGGYLGSRWRGAGQSTRTAATIGGTVLGALAGQSLGGRIDDVDCMKAQGARQAAYTAPIGQGIDWSNPETGNYGRVTPTREGRDNRTGAYCREYQQTVTIGGRQEQAYGTACRRPDGSWEVQS
ncbi:MAG: RT0821/Lpp0805 family surface protein [Alphaproteobacteria bacterium]|nr:RT0821/Lpp0805 family surface protein [Alphaproteobacteria bacterium]